MSQMLNRYNFYLSSKNRSDGDPSNWNINLKTNISLNKERNTHFRVYIQSVQIPFSFSQWNSFTNTTFFTLNRNGVIYNSSFTISNGNYSILTFTDEWIFRLIKAIDEITSATYTPIIQYTYNVDTDKVTLVLSNDGTPTIITFQNESGYDYVNLALGFLTEWNLSSGVFITSQVQCNINTARNLYIYSDTMSSPTNFEALVSDIRTSTQLSIIPILVAPNSYIQYYFINPIVSRVNNKDFSNLNFQIKSENIDANLQQFFLNWSLVFVIEEWEVQEPMVSIIEHLQAINDTKQKEQEKQRNDLEKQREEVIKELENIKKKTKKSLIINKEDETERISSDDKKQDIKTRKPRKAKQSE